MRQVKDISEPLNERVCVGGDMAELRYSFPSIHNKVKINSNTVHTG